MYYPENYVKEEIESREGNLAVIDGSLVAFRAAAAGEKRTIIATHRKSNREKSFSNRTELKKLLAGKFDMEEFDIQDIVSSPPLSQAKKLCDSIISGICKTCDAEEYLIFLDEGATTRDHIATVMKYKGNRDGKIKPLNLKATLDHMVSKHGAVYGSGLEADDILNMYMYEGWKLTSRGSDRKIIACTFDKDAKSHDGWMFDFRRDDKGKRLMDEPILIDGFGSLYLDGKDVRGEGRKHLYYQWTFGDDSDNYKPRKLSGKRFGAKAAYSLLNDLETDEECLRAVADLYYSWYPEPVEYETWDNKTLVADWVDLAQEYYSLCHMLRWPHDYTDVELLFSSNGVDVKRGRRT